MWAIDHNVKTMYRQPTTPTINFQVYGMQREDEIGSSITKEDQPRIIKYLILFNQIHGEKNYNDVSSIAIQNNNELSYSLN